MQIVTDSGTDVMLSPEEMKDLKVHIVPLNVTLDDKTYREGIDIEPKEFYELLEKTESLPKTSQPSAGEFAELYRQLAKEDPNILSIHMTSGLSGTWNSAKTAAEQVQEANITLIDTKTLSAGAGWQVSAAARAVKAGWAMEKVQDLVKRISEATESIYTLKELKYLIRSHLRRKI